MYFFQGEVGGPCQNDDDANGDECNFDTGYDEYQQESLDMHWTVMSTTFRTDEEAYDFYNDYAKKCGFSIEAVEEVSLFKVRETTGQVLYHGREEAQAESGDSVLLRGPSNCEG